MENIRWSGDVEDISEAGALEDIREAGDMEDIRESGDLENIRESGDLEDIRESGDPEGDQTGAAGRIHLDLDLPYLPAAFFFFFSSLRLAPCGRLHLPSLLGQ